MQKLTLLLIVCTLATINFAHATTEKKTCTSNPQLQKKKSAELQRIAQEDQADRSVPVDSTDWDKVDARDLERRIQVATIFAEGCLKEASDYTAAALVFQHSDSTDHFYQTFLWAKKAVDLGAESQRWLTAAGLDRYLVKTGQKQLFGTQFYKNFGGLWCIEPVEKTFPETRRFEFLKMNLHDSIAIFLNYMKSTQLPNDIQDCAHIFKSSPAGTVPGFW